MLLSNWPFHLSLKHVSHFPPWFCVLLPPLPLSKSRICILKDHGESVVTPHSSLDLCLEPGALQCIWNYIGINTEIDVVMDMDGDTHTCMQSQLLWHEDTLAALCRGPCGEELRPSANCQCTLVIGSHLGGAVTLELDPSPPVKTSDEPSQYLAGFAWDT